MDINFCSTRNYTNSCGNTYCIIGLEKEKGKEIKNMKTLRKRTKIEAIGLALLILALSIGSVLGTTILKDPSGTTPGNGFVNPTYIWNSNGQCWVATATNLQTSLNLRGTTFLPASTITINFTITIPSNTSPLPSPIQM